MNAFREWLVELIGAEIQAHPVTLGGVTVVKHFRQFDEATGRRIFAVRPDESIDARGERLMNEVIAASACTADGTLIGDAAGVALLPSAARQALWQAAARTNLITVPDANAAKGNADESNADPGDEAAGPNA